MAQENIKILEEKNIHLWFEGSPVALCSTMLALDIDKAELFASAKFLNVHPDNIKTVCFDIICYDAVRQTIACIADVAYTGFDVPRNEEFGYKRRVPIPDPQTRSVEFVLKNVSATNGDTWINDSNHPFDTSLEQKSIFTVQGDLHKQFVEICSRGNIDDSVFSFQPVFKDSYWMCGCGCFNLAKEEECFYCGVGQAWLKRNSDLSTLTKQSDFETEQKQKFHRSQPAFMPTQEELRMEREELQKRNSDYKKQLKKQKMQGSYKRIVFVIALLAIIGVITLGVVFYVIPYFKYNQAVNHFDTQRYDEAIAEFSELGSFMESKSFLSKSIYAKAAACFHAGQYEEASELFKSIDSYGDSHDQYLLSELLIAENAFNSGDYMAAYDRFMSIVEREESSERAEKCFEMIYKQAQRNLVANTMESLETGIKELTFIKGYKDSDQQLERCTYILGNAYYAHQNYRAALKQYQLVSDYSDAAQKVQSMSVLIDLISAADENTPSVWSAESLYCSLCEQNTAACSLTLSLDGHYSLKFSCPNHEKSLFSQEGIFKVENKTFYQMKNISEHKIGWDKIFEITDFKQNGKNSAITIQLAQPFDSSLSSFTLHGSVQK